MAFIFIDEYNSLYFGPLSWQKFSSRFSAVELSAKILYFTRKGRLVSGKGWRWKLILGEGRSQCGVDCSMNYIEILYITLYKIYNIIWFSV